MIDDYTLLLCHGVILEKDMYHLLAPTMCYVMFFTSFMWCAPPWALLVGAPPLIIEWNHVLVIRLILDVD